MEKHSGNCHKTLCVTPAMEANIDDPGRTVEEIGMMADTMIGRIPQ
jgi:hypothetical protein